MPNYLNSYLGELLRRYAVPEQRFPTLRLPLGRPQFAAMPMYEQMRGLPQQPVNRPMDEVVVTGTTRPLPSSLPTPEMPTLPPGMPIVFPPNTAGYATVPTPQEIVVTGTRRPAVPMETPAPAPLPPVPGMYRGGFAVKR